MCGYVEKLTKINNINQLLEAMEASANLPKGHLGRLTRSLETGQVVPDGTGEISKGGAFTPNGKKINLKYNEGSATCQIFFPPSAFNSDASHGVGLSAKSDGTWSIVTYDYNSCCNSQMQEEIKLNYAGFTAVKDLQRVGANIVAHQEAKSKNGQKEHNVYAIVEVEAPATA
jgi:hypothetical protein